MFKTTLLFTLAALCCAAQTTAIYNPESLTAGPFPSNVLTVADRAQKTGLRVNLPVAEDTCEPASSAVICSNQQALNTLDGFSLNPRLMVCFSAAVNTATLQAGISLIPLSGAATPIAINQVIYDPGSNCAFAKPNQVLSQDASYLLLVTDAVTAGGNPLQASSEFKHCLHSADPYCQELEAAIKKEKGAAEAHVVSASVFTTMTATAWLQQAERFTDAYPALALPAGLPAVFSLSNLSSFTWNTDQSGLPPQAIPLQVLAGVGKVGFGLFLSPNFLGPEGTVTFGPSSAPLVPSSARINFVSFHVFTPATPAPKAGYPVILYGHGLGDAQFGAPTFFAGKVAQKGFATLAIEITGHGYGPKSTVTLTDNSGHTYTEFTPGRGVLLPGAAVIGPTDGCILVGTPIGTRDCNLQTAVDLAAMVKTIKETGGLGLNLDPTRVYYVGQSEGSIYGTIFEAVEPNSKAAVFSVGGGTSVDIARLAITARPLAMAYAGPRGVLNVPPANPEPYFNDLFNDNYVFRDQPPGINTVPGALALQAAFESADWLQMPGDPLSFAAHLKNSPLPGVPAKSILFLFSKGDLEVPNPTNSALIRAAGAQSNSWYFQFDKAVRAGYTMLDPHASLSYPTIFGDPTQTSVALAEQQQVASFFASDGKTNPDPNRYLTAPYQADMQLFVIPASLPEQLNFCQLSPENSVFDPAPLYLSNPCPSTPNN